MDLDAECGASVDPIVEQPPEEEGEDAEISVAASRSVRSRHGGLWNLAPADLVRVPSQCAGCIGRSEDAAVERRGPRVLGLVLRGDPAEVRRLANPPWQKCRQVGD
jgi:hypothetical protein